MPALVLEREASLAQLLPRSELDRWEASGVMRYDGAFHVVFDNARVIAVLDESLSTSGELITLRGRPGPGRGHEGRGFEDLARDPLTGHTYLVVESLHRRGAGWRSRVEEYDPQWNRVARGWLDVPLPSSNKGIEGLTFVQRDGSAHLLGLLEGNFGESGPRGRTPGGGRIHVFARDGGDWRTEAVIELPAALPFEDYSALAASGNRLAVVSQESAAVWIGELTAGSWQVEGGGRVYPFPRAHDGGLLYGTVEGVSWLAPDRLVMVSDRAKDDQPLSCRRTQESIHLFRLPGAGEPGA
jgi:hypothetical protein